MPTVKEAMSELGRIGGSVKSAKKAEASRRNGKLGGRPLTNRQINALADKFVREFRAAEGRP